MANALEGLIAEGQGDEGAVDIGDGIFMSKGIANSYLVTGTDGDLLVNTGLPFEAPTIASRFAAVSASPLQAIVFTQGHPDHVGGWSQFGGPGIETIAQANHPDVREYWRRLHPFYASRIAVLWGRVSKADRSQLPPEPELTTTFVDHHEFDVGGRRVELFATPGGEALDALVVWLPDERTVLIGNLMGPMFGHVPNLYTIRGDKVRSAQSFLRGLERVLALEPDVFVNGHDVVHGADEIRSTIEQVHAATTSLRDQTIEGMNAGRNLWDLMSEVRLPPELSIPEVHGKVPWNVRAIWEEHAGWFRYESTTELYDVPPTAVWDDLVDLAGADALVSRAGEHVARDRPLHALHLVEMVRSADPTHGDAAAVQRAALELLLEHTSGANFSETEWIRQTIASIETEQES